MRAAPEPSRREYLDVESSDSDGVPCQKPRVLREVAPSAIKAAGILAVAVAVGVVCFRAAANTRSARTRTSRLNSVELESMPATGSTASDLKPLELLHDGNVCDINEELFAGLCYKKCSLLTGGEAPIRTTSWTCCENHPCTPLNQKGKIGPTVMCTGYDVGGDGSCPHKPGACLVDEEMFLGVCYKKCRLLTDGTHPNRVGPASCCKTHGLACLNPRNDQTGKGLVVGGGAGDSDPSTLASAHLPQESLTESGESSPSAEIVSSTPGPSTSSAAAAVAIKPVEAMHDGNVCLDNEEFYGGLCYGKCNILTNGRASIRTSSWTCCTEHPCFPWKQLGSVGTTLLCNGYDVSGDGHCPHKPGACLVDEELHLGICYKKCGLLTEGAFPHRIGPDTCCKTGGLGCLDIRNDKTSKSFDVGGGAGDHDASTPAKAHTPEQSLTESSDVAGAQEVAVVPRRLRIRT